MSNSSLCNDSVYGCLALALEVPIRNISSLATLLGLIGNALCLVAFTRQVKETGREGLWHQLVVLALDLVALVLVVALVFFSVLDASGKFSRSIARRQGLSGAVFVWSYWVSLPLYQILRSASLFFLLGMSLERLEAVAKPGLVMGVKQRPRAFKVLAVAGLFATLTNLHHFILWRIQFDNHTQAYSIAWDTEMKKTGLVWVLSGVEMMSKVLVVIMVAGCGFATYLIFKRSHFISGTTQAMAATLNRLYLGQVSLVVTCYLPWLVYKFHHAIIPSRDEGFVQLLVLLVTMSSTLEVALNFLVYVLISRSFRAEVWGIIRRKDNIQKISIQSVSHSHSFSHRRNSINNRATH